MTAKKYITNREYLRNVRENYSIKKKVYCVAG